MGGVIDLAPPARLRNSAGVLAKHSANKHARPASRPHYNHVMWRRQLNAQISHNYAFLLKQAHRVSTATKNEKKTVTTDKTLLVIIILLVNFLLYSVLNLFVLPFISE